MNEEMKVRLIGSVSDELFAEFARRMKGDYRLANPDVIGAVGMFFHENAIRASGIALSVLHGVTVKEGMKMAAEIAIETLQEFIEEEC